MRFNCVIDTSSYINLNMAEFKQKSVLKYLYDNVNVHFSNEVHLEIKDHYKKEMPSFLRRQRDLLRPKKYTMAEYEKRIVGKSIQSRTADKRSKDKGEVDNFIVSIDQIINSRKNGIVYIGDDEKSARGILSGWAEAFPAINVWSSYEVILYLYSEGVIPTSDIAVNLIQQLNSSFAPKNPASLTDEKKNELSQKLIKRLSDYKNRIEKVKKIINK